MKDSVSMECLPRNQKQITHFCSMACITLRAKEPWRLYCRMACFSVAQQKEKSEKNFCRRKYLCSNWLPANLFYNTSIPTCIVVLKKHRDGRDVLFIDASQKFEKGKKQNAMADEHIDAVMELYKNRKTVEKESYLASFEDIEKNDFNLNIPRYVDNFEEEEEIDLDELLTSISTTDDEIEKTQAEFITLLKELTSTDEKIEASLSNLIRKMEG